jgi:3-dehydroquinate dehydratase
MKKLIVPIDKEKYDKLCSKFDNERQALDYIEIRLDSFLRSQRRTMHDKLEKFHAEINIIDPLIPILEKYQDQTKENLTQIVHKIIRRAIK